MRLEPDSKNYRPKLYTPNNSLWVPSENATDKTKSIARNLSDLCKENGPKNGQSNGTGQSNGAAAIHFVHAEELTTGSIAIKNVDVSELNVTVKDGDIKDLAGAKKWDRVYRVALGA